jgi:hypothetical protein
MEGVEARVEIGDEKVSTDYADYTDKKRKEQEQPAGAGRTIFSCRAPAAASCSSLYFVCVIGVICGYFLCLGAENL